MAEQNDQQREAAAKAATEKAEREAAAKAATDARKIVLLQDVYDPDRNLLPAESEVDRDTPWVKRCVLPCDGLWETKEIHELKARTAAQVAEAERKGREAVEKARKEAQ